MSATFAVRLDFGRVILGDREGAHRVAEILSKGPFSALERVSGRHNDHWATYGKTTAQIIEQHLSDPTFDAVSLQTKSGSELIASAEIETSLRARTSSPTALVAYITLPVDGTETHAAILSICELAEALQTGAGFISVEPDYARAHRLAIGNSRPKERSGLSELRQRGRRARDWKSEQVGSKLATVEWGTFLGTGHLVQVDLGKLQESAAFEKVIEISPTLAYVQVTANPLADLSGELEEQLPKAREALRPLLMDISDVKLD